MAFIEMPTMKLAFPSQMTDLVDRLLARSTQVNAPVPVRVTRTDPLWIASERREHDQMGAIRSALYDAA